MIIQKNWLLMPVLFVFAISTNAADKPNIKPPSDSRYVLQMSPGERAEFLAEMRSMMGSIQNIMIGIGSSDRKLIAEFARISGNKMARATPPAVRARLPAAFQDLGGPTHLMFEELVIRADTDEMDMLASYTGKLMSQCMACHAAFRVH